MFEFGGKELVGKWLMVCDDDDGTYSVGEIVSEVGATCVLVTFRPIVDVKVPTFSQLFGVHELTDNGYFLFDNQAQVEAFHKWLTERKDKKPKVVNLK